MGRSDAAPADASSRLPRPERLVAFTDAAVAIALTLLILPLVDLVPDAVREHQPVAEILSSNLATIGAFLLGFVVIARLWVAHHQLFGFPTRLTHPLVWLDLFWVLTITVLPFLVELVSTYGESPLVVRAFVGNLLVGTGTLTVLTVMMRRIGRADADGSGPPEDFVVGSIAATVNISVAFVVVVVAPWIAYYALLILFLDPLTTRVVRALRRA